VARARVGQEQRNTNTVTIKIKPLLLAATVAFGMIGTAHARWYIIHWGAEPCVPLDDVDTMGYGRLHYGSGQIKTPDDYAQWLKSTGWTLTSLKLAPHVVGWMGRSPGLRDTFFAVEDDRADCLARMAKVPD
jgi:hypothetical protein